MKWFINKTYDLIVIHPEMIFIVNSLFSYWIISTVFDCSLLRFSWQPVGIKASHCVVQPMDCIRPLNRCIRKHIHRKCLKIYIYQCVMSFKIKAVFRVYLLLDILPRDFQLLEKRAYWENGLKWNRNDRHSIYFHCYCFL